jgi:hypothetical protein
MLPNTVRTAVVLLLIGCASPAIDQPAAGQVPVQEPDKERVKEPVKEPVKLLDRLKEPDQGGGFHVTEHFAIVFGGIKAGSGIALGPAVSQKFADGGYAQFKAVYSLDKFYLLQARYDTRKFWDGRAIVSSRLRLQDAPKLDLRRLGPDAPKLAIDYGEHKTEASTRLRVQLAPALRIASSFGIEKYSTTGTLIDPAPPGFGTKPVFAHSFFSAARDSRTSPDYSRSGRLFEAGIHHYADLSDGQDAFGRFEGTAQQLIPTHGGKGVIDVSAHTWLSLADGDRTVPFFLMPTLGGSTYLRAYQSYRFRDRHAMMLRGEYRWAVHKMADVAGFVEGGKVASTVKGLGLRNMAEAVGVGLRVHTKTSSLVDLDLAHGRDGFKFSIGFTTGGS